MDDLLIQRGQEPPRTRLVLLHGWGADARDLMPLGEILSQASGLAIECMALNAPELHPAGSGRQWYGLFPEQWADAAQAVHELKQRIEALDLAVAHKARVVVTAAGESGMPDSDGPRVENASRMVDAALGKGMSAGDLYVDPLIFPISVDGAFGQHSLDAIRTIREKYGPEIHITGGMSNVSFGIPARKIINDVFLILAVEAGADSGIVDPVMSRQ